MASPRHRIMVVDDESDMRALVRLALEDQYEVFEAVNGLDAMLKLPRYEPDLAVVDIMMPLMDGHALCRRIRATEGYEEMPIVALSALDSREDMKSGYESGATVYLTKPFQPDRLLKNVDLSLQAVPPRHKAMTGAEVAEREARISDRAALANSSRAAPTPEPEEQAPAPQPVARPGRQGGHTRILLADDDDDFLTLARLVLEEHGYEVVTAHDGMDALEKIPEAQPDLYILDGMMPRMSGYQLLAMLRDSPDGALAPVIFISGKGDTRDRKTIESKGADFYLAKPFPPDHLVREIRRIERRPNFHVHPKRHSIRDLLLAIGRRKPVEDHSEEQKRLWKTYGRMEGFLRANKDKDPE